MQISSSQPKVSILIPIFNAADFLCQCLDSALAQTLKDIELLCLNDGSTDSSLKILKQYQKKDSRLKIITKPNTGYGDTMNLGLKTAKGKYIYLLEPDDWLEKNALDTLYTLAEKHSLDLIKAEFFEYDSRRGDIRRSRLFADLPKNTVFAPTDCPAIFYKQPSIWTALYRTSFLRAHSDLRFLPTPGASYQDAGFNFKTLALASRVMLLSDAFYHYRQDNPNSSVKSAKKLNAVVEEYDSVAEFLHAHNLSSDLDSTLCVVRASSYIWNMNRLPFSTEKEFAKRIKKDFPTPTHPPFSNKHARYCLTHPAIRHPSLYPYYRPFFRTYESLKVKLRSLVKHD